MFRLIQGVALVCLVLVSVVGIVPTASADCEGVTSTGCCEGKVLNYCASGYVFTEECPGSCGWNPISLYYECGFQGPAPNNTPPITCPKPKPEDTEEGGESSTEGGESCTPDCMGKACGPDSCGGSCGACPEGALCLLGVCNNNPEYQGSCAGVCSNSPNGICWCDDSCLLNGDCCADACQACGICTTCSPNCTGKECGDDGCGGTCGACPLGTSCTGGQCASPLGPTCKGNCGSSGQDGTCWCDAQCEINGDCCADACDECGLCAGNACIPNCAGKACGDNGCGQPCGICARTEFCSAGACVPKGNCVPDCSSKECGDNGCGGTCGACAQGEVCDTGSTFWTCAEVGEGGSGQGSNCIPNCGNKNCGGDGCGGSCGGCMPPAECTAAGLCQFPENTTGDETAAQPSDLQEVEPSFSGDGSSEPVIVATPPGGCRTGSSAGSVVFFTILVLGWRMRQRAPTKVS